jgi:hypothetical protein
MQFKGLKLQRSDILLAHVGCEIELQSSDIFQCAPCRFHIREALKKRCRCAAAQCLIAAGFLKRLRPDGAEGSEKWKEESEKWI